MGVLGLLALTAEPAVAQRTETLLGKVLDPSGRPIVGASLLYRPTPTSAFVALEHHYSARPVPRRTRSGRSGRYSLTVPVAWHARGLRGALLVRHGLVGALIEPKPTATNILCRPLARLRLATNADVHVQALFAQGYAFDLGWRRSITDLCLPAGSYRLTIITGDSIHTHALKLQAGQQERWQPNRRPSQRILHLAPQTQVVFPHLPWVTLPASPSPQPRQLRLADQSPMQFGVCHHHSQSASFDRLWVGVHSTTKRIHAVAPASSKVVVRGPNGPLAKVRLLEIRQDHSGQFAVLSTASTNRHGQAKLPLAIKPTTHLLAIHDSHAPTALPLPLRSKTITLQSGHALLLDLRPRKGPPTGVSIDLLWQDRPCLQRTYHADSRGVVHCANLPAGPVTVCIRSNGFLPDKHSIDIRHRVQRKKLTLYRGETLRGRVVFADGRPAAGAVVSATDPNGILRPANRTAIANRHGAFEFGGLPKDLLLRVSARLGTLGVRGCNSYISARHRLRADAEATILLQSEDPTLPGPTRNAK